MTLYLKNILEPRSAGITKRTVFAQTSNTSRQQIANNNRNSSNSSNQCLTADQLAMRTRLERDSPKEFKHLLRLITSEYLYLFQQDVTSHRII
ncbi:hypothetical protein AVEN_230262-1 [Araneus ventricosus]|uniref:Uncharacterized protein n=1 Tax=Araneus ventricosus TaxID=182803 RepID=A0A4Y2DQF6_ARAVE|nr:hypothetical protein AVEN_230262-1 [Araneus ventricosus]